MRRRLDYAGAGGGRGGRAGSGNSSASSMNSTGGGKGASGRAVDHAASGGAAVGVRGGIGGGIGGINRGAAYYNFFGHNAASDCRGFDFRSWSGGMASWSGAISSALSQPASTVGPALHDPGTPPPLHGVGGTLSEDKSEGSRAAVWDTPDGGTPAGEVGGTPSRLRGEVGAAGAGAWYHGRGREGARKLGCSSLGARKHGGSSLGALVLTTHRVLFVEGDGAELGLGGVAKGTVEGLVEIPLAFIVDARVKRRSSEGLAGVQVGTPGAIFHTCVTFAPSCVYI